MAKQEIVTESTEILPNGRGRIVLISHKRVLPKPKKQKKGNSLLLFYAKSNPESIKLRLFLNNGVKRYVLFPEGRILQQEERIELASALIASLHKQPALSPFTSHRKVTGKRKRHRSIRGLFFSELKTQSFEKTVKINNFLRRKGK
jgi:hypothetical protein